MSTENRIKVFVYGSLKKGQMNHRHLRNATFVCRERVPGYALCDVIGAGFPAVIEGEPEFGVLGEVYMLAAGDAGRDHLRTLDVFEGCPHLYRRAAVETEGSGVVWIYVWAGKPERLQPCMTENWEGAE